MSVQGAIGYAGDMLAAEAFRLLSETGSARLVDVRTKAEWAYVGVPDLSVMNKVPLLLEWQIYPSMEVDANFADRLSKTLGESSATKDGVLVFLCRSGVRSRQAAIAMTSAGWGPCLNISDGFEGPLDPSNHRNSVGGWRASGLPWRQT
jgi:rhodanese-related sulfurtransferase